MAGHKVTIGSGDSKFEFESKKDAKAYCKNLLGRYRNNQTVNEEDTQFLQSLLERHPDAVQKIGCGVKRFFRAGTGVGTDCFWVERMDGSKTDFSYIACVDARSKSLYQKFAEACRQSVQQQLDKAKEQHFDKHGDAQGKVKCEVTGELVGKDESHLDHKKPMTFQVIVHTFIIANNIQISSDMLSPSKDAQFVTTFVDKDIERRFQEYHAKVAQLRILKTSANLSLGGQERITEAKQPVLLR